MDRERLAEIHPETIILEPSALDAAILGVVDAADGKPVLLYSRRKLIEVFEAEGMTYDEACEHFEFNVAGSHMGPYSPLFLTLEWGD